MSLCISGQQWDNLRTLSCALKEGYGILASSFYFFRSGFEGTSLYHPGLPGMPALTATYLCCREWTGYLQMHPLPVLTAGVADSSQQADQPLAWVGLLT